MRLAMNSPIFAGECRSAMSADARSARALSFVGTFDDMPHQRRGGIEIGLGPLRPAGYGPRPAGTFPIANGTR